jgi:hypothetical protein
MFFIGNQHTNYLKLRNEPKQLDLFDELYSTIEPEKNEVKSCISHCFIDSMIATEIGYANDTRLNTRNSL